MIISPSPKIKKNDYAFSRRADSTLSHNNINWQTELSKFRHAMNEYAREISGGLWLTFLAESAECNISSFSANQQRVKLPATHHSLNRNVFTLKSICFFVSPVYHLLLEATIIRCSNKQNMKLKFNFFHSANKICTRDLFKNAWNSLIPNEKQQRFTCKKTKLRMQGRTHSFINRTSAGLLRHYKWTCKPEKR